MRAIPIILVFIAIWAFGLFLIIKLYSLPKGRKKYHPRKKKKREKR